MGFVIVQGFYLIAAAGAGFLLAWPLGELAGHGRAGIARVRLSAPGSEARRTALRTVQRSALAVAGCGALIGFTVRGVLLFLLVMHSLEMRDRSSSDLFAMCVANLGPGTRDFGEALVRLLVFVVDISVCTIFVPMVVMFALPLLLVGAIVIVAKTLPEHLGDVGKALAERRAFYRERSNAPPIGAPAIRLPRLPGGPDALDIIRRDPRLQSALPSDPTAANPEMAERIEAERALAEARLRRDIAQAERDAIAEIAAAAEADREALIKRRLAEETERVRAAINKGIRL